MISRRISCLPENDKYRRLARYIVDANHDGEKALMSEHGATLAKPEDHPESKTETRQNKS